jgi:hypothetical protein
MTDEEKQQAEAYIKLEENVNELIDERVRSVLFDWAKGGNFKDLVLGTVRVEIQNNPRSYLANAITEHVRLLNRENIK